MNRPDSKLRYRKKVSNKEDGAFNLESELNFRTVVETGRNVGIGGVVYVSLEDREYGKGR